MDKHWYKKIPRIDLIEKDKGWYINEFLHALYEIDLQRMDSRFLCMIDSDYNNELLQLRIGCKCNEYIVFLPAYQRSNYRIGLYDTTNGLMTYIPLEDIDLDYEIKSGYALFTDAYVAGEKIYLFGGAYPAIIQLDVYENKTTYINDWYYYLKDEGDINKYFSFMGEGVFAYENTLNAPMLMNNKIIQLNLNTGETTIIDLGVPCKGCAKSLPIDTRKVLLAEYGEESHRLFVWNAETSSVVKTIDFPTVKGEYTLSCVGQMCVCKKNIYVSTVSGECQIFCFDMEDLEQTRIIDVRKKGLSTNDNAFVNTDFTFMGNVSGQLMCVTGRDLKWHILTEDGIEDFECELKHDTFVQTIRNLIQNSYVSEEVVPVSFFVDNII